ncbi:MAG: hypothetical protein EAZ30_14605 [Betaproteobacteria bacterium]|nr:MAG: hypothetical protein EAZ30_14605 [Betaproteobacteria bacterium]
MGLACGVSVQVNAAAALLSTSEAVFFTQIRADLKWIAADFSAKTLACNHKQALSSNLRQSVLNLRKSASKESPRTYGFSVWSIGASQCRRRTAEHK